MRRTKRGRVGRNEIARGKEKKREKIIERENFFFFLSNRILIRESLTVTRRDLEKLCYYVTFFFFCSITHPRTSSPPLGRSFSRERLWIFHTTNVKEKKEYGMCRRGKSGGGGREIKKRKFNLTGLKSFSKK